ATHPHVVFGPPVVLTYSVDRTKIGWQPGCDSALVAFTFDQPVPAWSVRINSSSALDGTTAASYEGEPVQAASAEITAEHLLQGDNRVAIYGRAPTGEWSV